jgi:orotidine-5'-phosphate decarboxylase
MIDLRSRICLGLDPDLSRMPEPLLRRHGLRPDGLASGPQWFRRAAACAREFCEAAMEAAGSGCAAVKPQMAWFEILGAPGMQALRAVALKAMRLGLPVILDGKRNDIGHTAAQYARAYLGPARGPEAAAVPADALTVTPYLGSDGLRPFIQRCLAHQKGVFVLAATSNPSGAEIQDLPLSEGGVVADRAAALIRACGDGLAGAFGYGPAGAVVGATRPEMLARLRGAMPESIFLLPGFGAQGARAEDIGAAFDERGLGAVVNASRSLLFGPAGSPDKEDFARNIANRTENMRREIENALALEG